jgi:hypothetical protein
MQLQRGDEHSTPSTSLSTMTSPPTVKVNISAAYDGGNISLVSKSTPQISSGGRSAKLTVQLNVRPDVFTELE